ncbi:MAG: excinuclease ABC subunit UvrA [Chromatiales bacterium]|nr:excinuclease ABC subunit UvrA [Chromatiales bacterium]
MPTGKITLRSVRQNNLKGLDLEIPLGQLVVVTGVSGSGKSSLAFDTIYAEGQRRYVETFSAYARQFLDRMDRPAVDRIDGIPPSIAIDQTNPVRTSRSTVGTMTELNDHLKLLFARASQLFCSGCGREVVRDSTDSIAQTVTALDRAIVTFTVPLEHAGNLDKVRTFLASQGYTRIHREDDQGIEVVQDRLKPADDPQRLADALDHALHMGGGRVQVYPMNADRSPGEALKFSTDLHCPDCDLNYRDPQPNQFSFNSPLGACPTCRGFGRVIGIDPNLVVPDAGKTIADGAVRPFQTDSFIDSQGDLMRACKRHGIATNIAWRDLPDEHRDWIWRGEGPWKRNIWYGINRFFEWLESKAYKMHIRVLLSKYRAYNPCPDCGGARLQTASLLHRIGTKRQADAVLAADQRHYPNAVRIRRAAWHNLPGLNLHDVMLLPIDRAAKFFADLTLPAGIDQATDLMLGEIRARLGYLQTVGLGYLTLDRQSRTLSGGEVQRINLTTALGTSLVNTLFVLDEPSIGLHPRDMQRMVTVLHRLRDAGNSLLVVEHDPQVILAADRILDIGPGPGEHGGDLIFQGTPKQLLRSRKSRTADYLAGRAVVSPPQAVADTRGDTPCITVRGASANNLKNIDVVLPLRKLVCVTGVSGSGKSTLIHDVLYNALASAKGHPNETPGEHQGVDGAELIDDVVLLDQSPIGKTSRSNPASYVGAFDAIRKRFAKQELAKSRRYTAGTFSFNAGTGRCPTCRGTGFEHVEMQFLSDVHLRCPDCNGTRYRQPVLTVEIEGKSIADVLAMTVTEAANFFADDRDVVRALAPLEQVGLGYLRLGQPVPTLSGGEAQRLKLAGHLVTAGKRRSTAKGLLFLLDEPTTGLHFDDIAVLLKALRRLTNGGHSVVLIEHNLDVMLASDWLVDLGPEGGDGGGRIVCTGTPEAVSQHPTSHTGAALRRYASELSDLKEAAAKYEIKHADTSVVRASDAIEIRGAREHNLKNISASVPRDRFTVVTGVSGSGKSTLAFDILFAEGQRRYLESLNAYARQFVQPATRADVDGVFGIPPTVAIEQRTSRGGRKSTVATLTETYHFLRLLFVKLGIQYCPDCRVPIEPQPREAIIDRILDQHKGQTVSVLAPLVIARKGIYKELAKWAERKGHTLLRVDGELLPTQPWPALDRHHEHNIDLPLGELRIAAKNRMDNESLLGQALEHGKGTIRVIARGKERSYSTRRACPSCNRGFDEPDPRLFSYNSKHGWCPTCFGNGVVLPGFDPDEASGEEAQWLRGDGPETPCPQCHGTRLRPEALDILFARRSIAEIAALSINSASEWIATLTLDQRQAAIAKDVLAEIASRLAFLKEVGLGYLTLDRAAPTLSGGEAQRIRLAAQLGSNLRGVCYVLDEPSIGLHPRDNSRLLDTLHALRAHGNTVVVVEHDEEAIERAEHVIDLGPGAGVNGGRIVAEGKAGDLKRNPASITGQCLAQPLKHPLREHRRPVGDARIVIRGADTNNLKNIDVSIPLKCLVGVTGVSGSGKSTLVREVLVRNLTASLDRRRGRPAWQGCTGVDGMDSIERLLEVDQTPIGKTPRSCPATYIGFWDAIRGLFAGTDEARIRGWTAARFSFNTGNGRCETCDGQGLQRVEMNFLPDVKVVCESCGGQRFNAATLAVHWRGRSAGDVLAMSVDEAVEFFAAHPKIHHPLTLLQDVGLGYLTLGQHSPTLSGGEAQRLKLVTELARNRPNLRKTPAQTLYVLDEPTVGLHMADVARLINVLHRLVDEGHSVLVIEHNLDVIAEADWLIDLGPEAGDSGGQLVAEGTPEQVAQITHSHTGTALRAVLDRTVASRIRQR